MEFVERPALVLQAAVLLRAGNPVAESFCRSWIGGAHGRAFGTLSSTAPLEALIERILPAV